MSGIAQGAVDRLKTDVGELLEARVVRGRDVDFSRYANDPIGFIRDVLHETEPGPWSAQIEIAESVRDHQLTVVQSNNSAGKDWLSARLALWWVYCCNGLVLLSGPTERQVREVCMKEVRRAFNRAPDLHGELFSMALRTGEADRGILAFTSADASRLTGFHAPKILAILTEAQGCEEYAFEAIFSCATGEDDRILAVGNPLSPTGRFYNIATSGSWNSLTISASDHPNLIQGKTVIPGGPTTLWAERIAQEYGRGSGTYRSRVEGQFPDSGEESLFLRSWLDDAAQRWEDNTFAREAAKATPLLSCDPARHGPDATCVAVRRGPVLESLTTWHGSSLVDTAERVSEIAEEEGVTPRWQRMSSTVRSRGRIVVDTVGVGAGVTDILKEKGFSVVQYQGGAFTGYMDRKKFLNERARSFWHLRKLLEDGVIALPPDAKLFDELMATNWTPTMDDRVQFEKKTALKARLGRSPDRADAVVMAFSDTWNRNTFAIGHYLG